MINNILSKLEKKGDTNLKVEPIYINDKKKFYLDNFLKNQKFLNYNEVIDILKINYDNKKPIGYILIKDEKDIVGFLGTIFSNRPIEEKLVEHCYLHSWIVSKNHRLEAFKLIIPIIKKNIFISTYSPVKSLEGLYKKIGFEEIIFFSKFVLSFSFFSFKKNNINFNEDSSFFEKYLNNNEKNLLYDHMSTNTEKIFFYLNDNKNDNFFMILKRRTRKFFFPVLEIIYVSNLDKFKTNEKKIGFELLKRFKTFFFKINILEKNDIFSKNFILKKNIKKKAYYYNKPKNFKFDVLYSELLR